MELKIELKPEDINREVSEAILKSTLGKAMQESIVRMTSRLTQSWDNPIDAVLLELVKQEIRQVIQVDFKEKVQAAVKAKLTEEIVNATVEKAFEKVWK